MNIKLEKLAKIEGMTVDELMESAVSDSVCYGICANDGCDYTTTVEPDQRCGHCENCGTSSVKSVLVLMGI